MTAEKMQNNPLYPMKLNFRCFQGGSLSFILMYSRLLRFHFIISFTILCFYSLLQRILCTFSSYGDE